MGSMAWEMLGSALVWLALNLMLIAGFGQWVKQSRAACQHDDPMAILRIRAIRGEISEAEYAQVRTLLEGGEDALHRRA